MKRPTRWDDYLLLRFVFVLWAFQIGPDPAWSDWVFVPLEALSLVVRVLALLTLGWALLDYRWSRPETDDRR